MLFTENTMPHAHALIPRAFLCVKPRQDSFCRLTHLVRLDLSSNRLQELPVDFGDLASLKHLNLFKNQLRCVACHVTVPRQQPTCLCFVLHEIAAVSPSLNSKPIPPRYSTCLSASSSYTVAFPFHHVSVGYHSLLVLLRSCGGWISKGTR